MAAPTIFETCQPREDILRGAVTDADFAADLASVVLRRFCAFPTGVQVLVESHSDHVLNGIRRAAKAGVLEPEDAALQGAAGGPALAVWSC